jgi:hypothetical protein
MRWGRVSAANVLVMQSGVEGCALGDDGALGRLALGTGLLDDGGSELGVAKSQAVSSVATIRSDARSRGRHSYRVRIER